MLHSLESHGACICSMANLILSFFLFCTLGDFIVKLKHRRPKQLICPFNLHPPITKSNMVHHELTNFNFKMSHIPDLVTYSEDIYVHYRKWYTSNITYSSFDRKCLIPQNDFIAQYNVIFMPWQHYPSDSRRGWMRLNNEQNVKTEELSVTKEAPNAVLLYYIFIFYILCYSSTIFASICKSVSFHQFFQVEMFFGAFCSYTFSPLVTNLQNHR